MTHRPTAAGESVRPARSFRKLWLLLAVALLAAMAFAGYRLLRQPSVLDVGKGIDVDLAAPDFLLNTRELSRLPKDIAAAPLLSGLVDEELVFHYEEDEARLSVEGAIRRLAYEHKLDLSDRFLATLLAAPAEIGVWRGGKGRPEHFVAVIERGVLGKLSETLARIVANDQQIKLAGTLKAIGTEIPIYALDYGGGRRLAFAGKGERWVVLSDPALALNENGEIAGKDADLLLDLLRGKHVWFDQLTPDASADHSIVIGARALTFDYAAFFPNLTALRFDHDGKGWHVAAQLRTADAAAAGKSDFTALWRFLPGNAALCAALPVNWQAAEKPLQALTDNDAAVPTLLAALDPVAGVCWYPDARLSAPLFVARATRPLPAETGALLEKVASRVWKGDGEQVEKDTVDHGLRFSRVIESAHGSQRSADGQRQFEATLAQHGDLFFFSPDRRPVDAALAVADKRAPALGDVPGFASGAVLMYDPARLGELLRNDIQEVLPQDEEAYFRGVARSALWPRLDAWGKRHPAALLVPGHSAGKGFVSLDYKAMKAAN